MAHWTTCLPVLLCMAHGALAQGVIAEFQGEGPTVTDEFVVEAPWLLTWIVRSDYPEALGFEMGLVDARTGLHAGRVLKTNSTGGGYKLFEESGRYQFTIQSSFGRWLLRVEEITQEEADELIRK